MPTVKPTKVLYDVKQAIKELTKLDKKVKKSGKTAKKGFETGNEGGNSFLRKLNKINPKLGSTATKALKMKAAIGGAGAAFGIAAGAVIGATAAVLDFNNSLRNGEAVIGDFIASAREVREVFDDISASQDARRDFQFLDAKEAIAESRAVLTQLQIRNDARKENAAESLSIEKSRLSSLQSALTAAHRKTLSAEKRLADKRAELAGGSGEFSNQPKGRQVTSLTAKATQLAGKGRIDEAEALIDRAKELSNELGNHVFFTDKIQSANSAVVRALEKNVKESKSEEGTLQGKVKAQEKVVSKAQEQLTIEKGISKEIANRIKLLGIESALLGARRKKEKQLQRTDQGAREVTSEQTGVRNEIENIANQSGFTEGLKVLGDQMKRLSLRTGFGSGEDITAARDLEGRVLDTASRGATAKTPGAIEAVTAERAALVEELARLRSEVKTGERSPAINRTLDRLGGVLEGLKGLGKAGKNLGAVGENESIQASQLRQRADADQAQESLQNVQAKTVNYNVKIEGGMVDEKTIKQIEERLTRRERKGTNTD